MVVGLRDSVAVVNLDGSALRTITPVDPQDADTRLNDGKVDPTGGLVFGTLSESRQPAGGCYRLGRRSTLQQVFPGMTLSNGLGWDVPRGRFYLVDSWTWRIDVCDFNAATGEVSDRRQFATIDPQEGLPDGLSVDVEGGVWVALFGGGAVRRYDSDGVLSEVVSVPVTYPTSLTFGGPNLRTVFVTSSRHRMSRAQRRAEQLAGAVLTFDAAISGVAPFDLTIDLPPAGPRTELPDPMLPPFATANPERV